MAGRIGSFPRDHGTKPYKVGQAVRKIGGDYRFTGHIVAAFKKHSGAQRYVVENADGLLFIFNHTGLEAIE